MLTLDEAKVRLLNGCRAIVAASDRLTAADRAVGDGDHGLGMARGFRAAEEALETKTAGTVGELFKIVGMSVMTKAGGACGAVFGTLFMSAGKSLEGVEASAEDFANALEAGMEAVKARGQAHPGDKTVIDALVPAISCARESAAKGFEAAAAAAAAGAAQGTQATKGMVARTGKARSLGERSVGYVDPGALSLSIFLEAFAGSRSERAAGGGDAT